MPLKSQDVVVLLKRVVLAQRGEVLTYGAMALELGLSSSETHAAVRRLAAARLLDAAAPNAMPIRRAAEEFLVYGVKYAFYPQTGALLRGLPTGYAAPPLAALIAAGSEPVPVWPDADGSVRGIAFAPLYPSVPFAARRDATLYEWLALLDAVRGGRARERALAVAALGERLAGPPEGAT